MPMLSLRSLGFKATGLFDGSDITRVGSNCGWNIEGEFADAVGAGREFPKTVARCGSACGIWTSAIIESMCGNLASG
jgi:hypothetical protein